MSKKCFMFLAFTIFVAANVYALPELKFGGGAGGYFTGDFGGGANFSVSDSGNANSFTTPYGGGSGFVFVDMTFAELSFGFWGAFGNWEIKPAVSGLPEKFSFFGKGLDIGLLLKYPFGINEKIILSPLFGITYRFVLWADLSDITAWVVGYPHPMDLNSLWFKCGAGGDYFISEAIYARVNILYGLRLENQFERDMAGTLRMLDQGEGNYIIDKLLPGHGFEIKIAGGLRF